MTDVRFDLTDRHHQHPDAVLEHARDKIGKLTRFLETVQHIEVILEMEHDQHRVESIVTANHHQRFVGHAVDDSVLTAIDRVVEKLERQLVKAKERMQDRHRRVDPIKKLP